MEFEALLTLMTLLATTASAQDDASSAAAVARANTQFTTDFYGVVSKSSGKSEPTNLIFSPFSLSACIGMLKAGAEGVTAEEIQRGMHFPEDSTLNEGFKAQLSGLRSNENFTLETANSVYTKTGFKLSPHFQSIVTSYFRARVEQLDFSDRTASAARINGFVERTTQDHIKDLISPSDLTQDTRLILVNAIYFKGLWKNRFDKANTVPDKFTVSQGKQVEVQMMRTTADFKYGEIPELDSKVVSLPYKGDRLSMVLILPNKVDGLPDLEKRLLNFDLATIQNRLHDRKIELSMPKFKLESEIDLQGPLEALGMRSMFDMARAELGGVAEDQNQGLYVSKAIQKAFLEVNEEGSEAAAATAFAVAARSGLVSLSEELVFDHPFLAYIQQEEEGRYFGGQRSSHVVLFFSAVLDPSNEAPFTLGRTASASNRRGGGGVLLMAVAAAALLRSWM